MELACNFLCRPTLCFWCKKAIFHLFEGSKTTESNKMQILEVLYLADALDQSDFQSRLVKSQQC